MRSRLLLSAALTGALLAPAAAGAVVPAKPPLPPKPPTDAALAAAGADVRWPISRPAVTAGPGTTYTVRVRRGSAPVTVSLVRLASSGRVMRTVAGRRLRRGAFTVTVPRTAPAAYALRLRAGGRTFFNVITVPPVFAPPLVVPQPAPAPAPQPAPRPAPPAPPVFEDPCPDPGRPTATMAWASPPAEPVAPASRLAFTVTNTGAACMVDRAPILQRETAPGVWEAVEQKTPEGWTVAEPAVLIMRKPGEAWAEAVYVTPDAVAGRYRVRYVVLRVHATFEEMLETRDVLYLGPFTVATP